MNCWIKWCTSYRSSSRKKRPRSYYKSYVDGKVSLLVKDFGFTCSQSGPRPDVYFRVFSKIWICDIWILKFFLACYIFLADTSSRTQVCII